MGKKFLYRLYTFMRSSSFQNQAQHMSACNKTAASRMGGVLHPPPPNHPKPPPPCFYSHPCLPEKGSVVSSPCLRSARVVQIILLANGGVAPQSPSCFQAAHVCNNKEVLCRHLVCSKRRRRSTVCSRLIFSEYIKNGPVRH